MLHASNILIRPNVLQAVTFRICWEVNKISTGSLASGRLWGPLEVGVVRADLN